MGKHVSVEVVTSYNFSELDRLQHLIFQDPALRQLVSGDYINFLQASGFNSTWEHIGFLVRDQGYGILHPDRGLGTASITLVTRQDIPCQFAVAALGRRILREAFFNMGLLGVYAEVSSANLKVDKLLHQTQWKLVGELPNQRIFEGQNCNKNIWYLDRDTWKRVRIYHAT